MDKKEIAEIFEEIAVLLELQDANPFRVRAYRNAAHTLLSVEGNLRKMALEGTLTDIPGIGKDLAEKIAVLVKTNRLPFYEKLRRATPSGLLEMMQISGLGPKKVKAIYEKLKIKSIDALKKACLAGKVAALPRFGKKTEQNILDALTHKEAYGKRRLWWDANTIAQPILRALKRCKGVKQAEIAGSLRRKLETVGDLDFVVAAADPKPIMRWFTSQPFVQKILAKGETKSSVRLQEGIQADLRIVPEKEYPFALCYLTGSKQHNIAMRESARKRGWTLNEYGMTPLRPRGKAPFPKEGAKTEGAIYRALGFSFIPPELRENRGELEAAAKNQIPALIEEKDIRGTFHNHTTASDGRNTLKEMVQAAEKFHWEYIGIADHSKSSYQANGQCEGHLLSQASEIQKLNASKKFRTHVFSGVECDILPNGKLDFSDAVLKRLDYVVISVHQALSQDEKTMTKRILRAIENPYTTMVGHVTGRLLLRREGYKVDLSKVIDACIANGKIMELNANPMRLDMDWRFWHSASEKGLLSCINPDAHSVEHLEFYRAGVYCARKGWLQKEHVFNTRFLKEILRFLRK